MVIDPQVIIEYKVLASEVVIAFLPFIILFASVFLAFAIYSLMVRFIKKMTI